MVEHVARDRVARGIDLVPLKFTPTMESGLALEGGELQLTRSYLLTAMFDINFGILSAKNGTERLGEQAGPDEQDWCRRWWPVGEGERAEAGTTRDAWWAALLSRARAGGARALPSKQRLMASMFRMRCMRIW